MMHEYGTTKQQGNCRICNKHNDLFVSTKINELICWECLFDDKDQNFKSVEQKKEENANKIKRICECGTEFYASKFTPYIKKCKDCRGKDEQNNVS
jgi:hypothetical protein